MSGLAGIVLGRERQGVEIELEKSYETTWDERGKIVSHYELRTSKPGKPMTKHQQAVWNEIAERNTASLNQLAEMKRCGVRPRVCKVEDSRLRCEKSV